MRGRAYGLIVEAPHLPPWFVPAQSTSIQPDVDIAIGTPGTHLPRVGEGGLVQRLSYPGLASVLIESGSRVEVHLEPGAGKDVVELLIAGPILGTVLDQRGSLVLHASAIRYRGEAVVFTGGSGWGKSTTAARIHQAGFASVADDVVPLDTAAGQVLTAPGYPLHKLWPDAARALGFDPTIMATIGLEGEKRRMTVTEGFLTDSLPVRRIYVLSAGDRTRVESLRGQDAFMELVRHAYLAKYLDTPERRARHMVQAGDLLRSVSTRRLIQGPQEELELVPGLVEKDLATA